MAENISVFDFELNEDEIRRLAVRRTSVGVLGWWGRRWPSAVLRPPSGSAVLLVDARLQAGLHLPQICDEVSPVDVGVSADSGSCSGIHSLDPTQSPPLVKSLIVV